MPLKPNREGLRSGSQSMLLIPKTKCKMFAVWSFSVAGSTLWNTLPEHLKLRTNIQTFKRELKTYLFIKAYQWHLILSCNSGFKSFYHLSLLKSTNIFIFTSYLLLSVTENILYCSNAIQEPNKLINLFFCQNV